MTLEEMLLRGSALTEKDANVLRKRLIQEYRKGAKALEKTIQAAYGKYLTGVTESQIQLRLFNYNRLVKIQKQMREDFNEMMRGVRLNMHQFQEVALSNKYYRDQYTFNWFAGETPITLEFTPLTRPIIQSVAFSNADALQSISNTELRHKIQNLLPRSGKTVIEELFENSEKQFRILRDQVTSNLMTGKNPRTSVTTIRDRIGKSTRETLTLLRTEQNRLLNTANYLVTEESKNQGLGVNRFIISTLDNRTRRQSGQVDGLRENEEGYFVYPGGVLVLIPGNSGVPAWDYNDRETVGEIIEGVEPTSRTALNPNTGERETVTFGPFEQWAKDNGLRRNIYGQLLFPQSK